MSIEVTEQFTGCVRADRQDNNILVMRRLADPYFIHDGKAWVGRKYELEYLQVDDNGNVKCADYNYLRRLDFNRHKSLFEQFNCF